MTRSDGFTVMDVSTDIVNDPKFRQLNRLLPDKIGLAFLAYISLLGECWKAGRRVTVLAAWPSFVAYDGDVAANLRDVGLIDRNGMVPAKAWNGWFRTANERREKARERWRRANANRAHPNGDDSSSTASAPRGSHAVTASTVPFLSVPFRTDPLAPSEPPRDAWNQPELEAIAWLARHGCALSETNGLRRKLIGHIERSGVNAVVGAFDRLVEAGVADGDARRFVFGLDDLLFPKPDLKALEREERAEDEAERFNRQVERTQREQARLRGEMA